jgi:FAD/FMN-containing dehydrogenase
VLEPDLPAFLSSVEGVVGATHVLTDPEVRAGHETDWTRRFVGRTPAVLRPGSVGEVQALVLLARRHQVSLVPQGGNTGLVGGATPLGGEVVLDLRRLDDLGPVDGPAGQVTVGAGVTLTALQDHAASAGLSFAVDLGARDTATVGGLVATNAGGLHVVRFGSMRAQVLGVEAVLGTGEVVRSNLTGLVKDNTGYDLPGLLCGSEGTLGVITSARVRLVPGVGPLLGALVGFASVTAAVEALPVLRSAPGLRALELMRAVDLRLVAGHLGIEPPLTPLPPAVVLLELEGPNDLVGALGAVLEALGPAVVASAVADGDRLAGLWRWREALPEVAAALGIVHKADVSLPVGALAAFEAAVETTIRAHSPSSTTLVYGHLGDGNLHVNVVGPGAADDGPVDAVLELVLELGGSVSAEHGVGRAKVAWAARQRGEVATTMLRAIKQALDPDGILNPGVVVG